MGVLGGVWGRVHCTHSRMALIPCIAISTGYILLVLFLCELARKLIAPLNPGLVKTALNEAIAAADLCGCCFELIIIADNYGIGAYFIYMFLLTIWWGQHWGDATACPYNHFEECVQGKMTKQETAVRTVAQTIGGVLVFRLIQVPWALEIAETHVGRSHSAVYNVCSADLTIPVLHGAIMEGICTLGCRGHTPMEHFVVYWIGSSLGALSSISIWPHMEEALVDKQEPDTRNPLLMYLLYCTVCSQ